MIGHFFYFIILFTGFVVCDNITFTNSEVPVFGLNTVTDYINLFNAIATFSTAVMVGRLYNRKFDFVSTCCKDSFRFETHVSSNQSEL